MNFHPFLLFLLTAQYVPVWRQDVHGLTLPVLPEGRKKAVSVNLTFIPLFTPHLKIDWGPDPTKHTNACLASSRPRFIIPETSQQWEQAWAGTACSSALLESSASGYSLHSSVFLTTVLVSLQRALGQEQDSAMPDGAGGSTSRCWMKIPFHCSCRRDNTTWEVSNSSHCLFFFPVS